jgi:macrolide transport system ATP-binding/permease protein
MSRWRRLRYLFSPSARRAEDRDIQEELDALRHLAPPGELGNLALAAEDARSAFGRLWLERLLQDLRYAARSMRHQKAFTTVVVTSLALGIGANTAIYSFTEAILLRPLPVQDPQSLVVLKWRAKGYALASSGMSWSTRGSSFDKATGTVSSIFPYPALAVFQESRDVLSSAFGYFSVDRFALTAQGETDAVKGQYVSGGYFDGIGIHPAAGRLIQPQDDSPGAASVAVLSDRFSRRRFGGPDAAVGQTVRLNDKPFSVIGVAPPRFFGAEPGAIPDIYIPIDAEAILSPGSSAHRLDDHFYWLEIMGRLKPGVGVEQAQTVLAAKFHQYVRGTATKSAQLDDLPILSIEPGGTGLDSLRRQYSRPIYVLMAMVGLILLVACSNIASLLLARAAARRREIAVRLGIGASRARIVRQLLTESLLLAAVGGALGIGIAWWSIGVLTALLSNGRENFTLHAELNWAVLGVTLALSLATGVLFGLAPALQATHVDIVPALKEVRANDTPRRTFGRSLGRTLIVVQVALSLVLLIGAALFGRSLAQLRNIEPGFDRENVLLFTIRPFSVGYQGAALPRFFEALRVDLSRLPGVTDVSLSVAPLPMGGGTIVPVAIPGARTAAPDGTGRAVLGSVGPGFFKTLRIGLDGRDFTDRDAIGTPKVVVVNRRLVKSFGLESALGRTMTLSDESFEIVGVADDALTFGLKGEGRAAVYFPYLQATKRPPGQMTYEIRTAGNPLALAAAVRQTVRQADSRIAIHDLKTQAAHIDQEIGTEIMLARLCAVFAVLALLIACVGVYGTVAFNVARRTNEIGVRMTLGARRGHIFWIVLREVVLMTGIGLGIGVPLALAGSDYIRTLLFNLRPHDPAAVAIAVAALTVCGLVAGLIPARRAAGLNPLAAIRHE